MVQRHLHYERSFGLEKWVNFELCNNTTYGNITAGFIHHLLPFSTNEYIPYKLQNENSQLLSQYCCLYEEKLMKRVAVAVPTFVFKVIEA